MGKKLKTNDNFSNIKINIENNHPTHNMIGKYPSKKFSDNNFKNENELMINKTEKKIAKHKMTCCNLDSIKSLLPIMNKVKSKRKTSTLNKKLPVTINDTHQHNHFETKNIDNSSKVDNEYKNFNNNSKKSSINTKTTMTPTNIVLSPILVSMETSKWRHPCVICNRVSCNCCQQNNMPPINHKQFHLIAHQQFEYLQQQKFKNQLKFNTKQKDNSENSHFDEHLRHNHMSCAFQHHQYNSCSSQHPCNLYNQQRVTLKRKRPEPLYDNIDYEHLNTGGKCQFLPNQLQYSFQHLSSSYSRNAHACSRNLSFLYKQYNDRQSIYQTPTKLYQLKDTDINKDYISNKTFYNNINLSSTQNIYNTQSKNANLSNTFKTIHRRNNEKINIENPHRLNEQNSTLITSSIKKDTARTKRVKKQTLHSIYHHLQNFKTSTQQSTLFISTKKISHSSQFSSIYSTSTLPQEAISASFLSPPISIKSSPSFKSSNSRESGESILSSSPLSSRSTSMPSFYSSQTPSNSSLSSSRRSNSFSSLNKGFLEPCKNYMDTKTEKHFSTPNEMKSLCDYNTESNPHMLFSNDSKNSIEIKNKKSNSLISNTYKGDGNSKSDMKTHLKYDYIDKNGDIDNTSSETIDSETIEWFKKLHQVKKKLNFSDGSCCNANINDKINPKYSKNMFDSKGANKENLDPYLNLNIETFNNVNFSNCSNDDKISFKKTKKANTSKLLTMLDNNTFHRKTKQEFTEIKYNTNLANNQKEKPQPHYTNSLNPSVNMIGRNLPHSNHDPKCRDKNAQINQIIQSLLGLETTYSLELDEGFQKYSKPLQNLLSVSSPSLFYQNDSDNSASSGCLLYQNSASFSHTSSRSSSSSSISPSISVSSTLLSDIPLQSSSFCFEHFNYRDNEPNDSNCIKHGDVDDKVLAIVDHFTMQFSKSNDAYENYLSGLKTSCELLTKLNRKNTNQNTDMDMRALEGIDEFFAKPNKYVSNLLKNFRKLRSCYIMLCTSNQTNPKKQMIIDSLQNLIKNLKKLIDTS